jgi:hypothetical protein
MPDRGYKSRDADNRERSAALLARSVEPLASLDHDLNVYFEYGQSNRDGSEAWPSLSHQPVPGNLMLGEDVRPKTTEGIFRPIGDGTMLQPLTARDLDGHSIPTAPADVALWPPTRKFRGETPGVGAVNYLRRARARRVPAAQAARHEIILANGALGNRSIDHLVKHHALGEVEHYGRYTDLLRATAQIAAAAGKTHQVLGIGWTQGESDYMGGGLVKTRGDYLERLGRLHADMLADAALLGGNSAPPGFFMWQVGGLYTKDCDRLRTPDLSIGMALWEYARATPGAWLVGPTYPYTDKLHHLDANGARWCGLKEGMVLDQVINQRRHWEPLSPLAIEHSGMVVDIHYHVPAPPLRFAPAYSNGQAFEFATRGFRVSDEKGDIPLHRVVIAAPSIVRLKLDREVRGEALSWYADRGGYGGEAGRAHHGMGNLCDSEDADPFYRYEYRPEWGMDAKADIPALVGRPYDMSNWAIAHCLPLGWSRPSV